MLATKAGVWKVIESDGRRLLNSRSTVSFLSSSRRLDGLTKSNYEICLFLRAYSSHSSWPRNNTCLHRKASTSAPSSSFYSSLSSGSSPTGKRINCYDRRVEEYQVDWGISLHSTTLTSSRARHKGHRSGSNMYSYPQDESRAFLSTSSSSESSSKRNEPKQNTPNYSTHAKIPIPKSSPTGSTSLNPLASIDVKAIMKGSANMTIWLTKTIFKFVIHLPSNTVFYATHPNERKEKIAEIKESIKKEVDHYWVGIKVSVLQ